MNQVSRWIIEIPIDNESAQKILKALQELFLAYPSVQIDNDSPHSESSYPPLKDGEDPF